MFAIKVIIEILVVLLICYGIWHEEELIELEDVLWWYVKNQFKKLYRRVVSGLQK